MKTIKKLGCIVVVLVAIGMQATAHAAPYSVELVRVYWGSLNGTLCSDVTDPLVGPCFGQITGTRSGIYDDSNGIVQMNLGTTSISYQINSQPFTELFTHAHTDWLTGSNTYAASAFTCVEGQFGSLVAATICGGYSWGENFIEESSIDYSSIPGTRTIGGDDVVIEPQPQGADYASSTALFTGLGGELIMNSPDWNGGLGTEATAGYQLRFIVSNVVEPPPLNDDFDYATTVIEPLPFSDTGNTASATTATDDPNCIGNGPTVWYSYTPSSDGRLSANTFGSGYDTTLSVYTGSRGNLTQIACNDDSGSLQSRVIWDGIAGTTYYLMVGAFASGPGGPLNFEVEQGPTPALDSVDVESALVRPKTGQAEIAFTTSFREQVFLIATDLRLLQRSGRGSIAGTMTKEFFVPTESISLTVPFSDLFGAKGFVGGPAEFCANVIYIDPNFGGTSTEICQEIRLQGSK